MPETKYFVSYSRTDSDFTLKLAQDLRDAKTSVWLDQLDIASGERWKQKIGEALEDCGGMIIVLSPDSVESINVKDEINFALVNSKRIVPVLIHPCKIPFRLQRIQYIAFTSNYNKEFEKLLRVLKSNSSIEHIPDNLEERTVIPEKPTEITQSVTRNPAAEIAVAKVDAETRKTFKIIEVVFEGIMVVILESVDIHSNNIMLEAR